MGVTKLILELLRTKAKIRVFSAGYTVAMVTYCGRHGSLIISALVSRSSSPGSSPGWGHCIVLCSWARHLILTVPLSTQVYKWVPVSLMLG